ncbi:N-acetylglucosamine kinase [Thiogranum longum]|uniref:N-acetylglucosamine kinase n=1 Tax=Thiogranum longum TaxID=1537524 RepID=A0A4R1HIL2_9GAMM|nr:ROK family protein [Thiogranum longum]TCK19279.1 N-acetylglucosamine kinase [Thiogranum longum]
MSRVRFGIDLGGTKTEIIALDEGGDECLRWRVATPQGDYPAILKTVTGLVTRAEDELACHASIGIGTPGAISPASGLMKNSNSTCLNGKPLRDDLQQALQRPIRLANDADCFALSEASDGIAADASSVFGVIVGTGTGAGIVVDGKLLSGINAIAGEWGHNPLPWPADEERPGPDCYCGRSGCIETWLSGPALERQYQQAGGIFINAQKISAAAARDEALAVRVIDAYVDRMARALAGVINLIDPDIIVLGGGVGNIERLYREVPQVWQQYVFSDRVDTQLLRPLYGDSSGVRGAAWLWSLEEILQG